MGLPGRGLSKCLLFIGSLQSAHWGLWTLNHNGHKAATSGNWPSLRGQLQTWQHPTGAGHRKLLPFGMCISRNGKEPLEGLWAPWSGSSLLPHPRAVCGARGPREEEGTRSVPGACGVASVHTWALWWGGRSRPRGSREPFPHSCFFPQ